MAKHNKSKAHYQQAAAPHGNRSMHHANQKKRPRSTSDGSRDSPSRKDVASRNTTTKSDDAQLASMVIQWLLSRKKSVPSVLKGMYPPTDMDEILKLLPDLRERERRALVRKVEKTLQNDGAPTNQKHVFEGSDNEYSENADDVHQHTLNDKWPSSVEFSNNYKWEPTVPNDIKDKYHPTNGARVRTNHFSKRVYFKRITDPDHPACGEYGLYCALPEGAPPGTWLLDYVGHVTLGENQNKKSDYVSDFGEQSELACDANTFGNEARFLNDFRNTGKHPNVEFNFRRDKLGELRQGVYVKLAKDSKVEGFDGVKQHEELLVSYGKSYWRSRCSDLADFVYRYPGQGGIKNHGVTEHPQS